MNPYLNKQEIKEAFRKVHLEENHDFLEEDLEKIADVFIMAAMPAIVKTEREMCIKFVNSLNTNVARALGEYREKPMTPKEFINELFGEGWKPSQLPAFVEALKGWHEDSQRYYVLRDFAKKLEFDVEARDRVACREFDDLVDAKRFEHDLDEN